LFVCLLVSIVYTSSSTQTVGLRTCTIIHIGFATHRHHCFAARSGYARVYIILFPASNNAAACSLSLSLSKNKIKGAPASLPTMQPLIAQLCSLFFFSGFPWSSKMQGEAEAEAEAEQKRIFFLNRFYPHLTPQKAPLVQGPSDTLVALPPSAALLWDWDDALLFLHMSLVLLPARLNKQVEPSVS
jgi:hypothetical protein